MKKLFSILYVFAGFLLVGFSVAFSILASIALDEYFSRVPTSERLAYLAPNIVVGACVGIALAWGFWWFPSAMKSATNIGHRFIVIISLLLTFCITLYFGVHALLRTSGIGAGAGYVGFSIGFFAWGITCLLLAGLSGYALYRLLKLGRSNKAIDPTADVDAR
jgi:hypothetical protein